MPLLYGKHFKTTLRIAPGRSAHAKREKEADFR